MRLGRPFGFVTNVAEHLEPISSWGDLHGTCSLLLQCCQLQELGLWKLEYSTITFTGESYFISVSVDQVEQMLQWLWVSLEVVATSRLDSLLRVRVIEILMLTCSTR